MATTTAVRVALRVRPLTQKERLCNSAECISFIPGQPQILIGKDHSFTYDHVYDTQSSQHHIYDSSVLSLVEKYVDGFNATILAYGQTGSGKTYSMGTAIDGNTGSEDQQGIVPRFIRDLYKRIEHKKANNGDNYNAQVFVSFLELYNEDLVDLLNMQQHRRRGTTGTSNNNDISIREDVQGNIYWSGVREEPCNDPDELLGYLTKGSLCRTTGSTDMNAVSSRSHAIFSVILKQQLPDEEQSEDNKTIVSKFHFVDLAGSERLKRTNAQGERAREGIAINSGLLALGNVISALGDEARRSTHIPYRDSKLTRLLQDSLGGNSQTLMMACVSPADTNFVETLSTLKYANRARNIKNRVTINQEFAGSSVEVAQLRSQVARLKMELNILRNTSHHPTSTTEMDALRHEVNRLRSRVQATSDELCQVTAERDTLLLDQSGDPNSNAAAPMIAHYQRTIRDLRNELEDTRERLTFVESTQGPVMDALQLMTTSPSPQRHRRTPPLTSRQQKSTSTTTTRRHRRNKKNHRHVTFRKSSKVPHPPVPVAPTDHDDINRWLQETMEPVNSIFTTKDIRTEVRDSISKARSEIEKGLRVLENVKSREHSQMFKPSADMDHTDDILMLDTTAVVSEDIQSVTPPADWESTSVTEQPSPHDHVTTTATATTMTNEMSTTEADDYEEDDIDLSEHPQLARIIHQVQSDIRVKEELVQQLERCEAEYDDMRRQFEHKLNQLVHEMSTIKNERDHALLMQQQKPRHARTSVERAAKEKQQIMELRNAYELKTKQLADMRRKFTHTSSAIQASRNQNESMLRALRVHVESLKLEKRRMVKRMKDETLRVKEQMSAHEREIQQLRRRQQRDAERRRRLEMENKQVQIMLRKRSDEVVVTNDKLQKIVQILKKAVREGGVLDDRMLARCADLLHLGFLRRRSSTSSHGNHRHHRASAIHIPVEVRAAKKKHLLDRALCQYIHGKQALLEMQELMAKRNELANKRAELQSEREHLYGCDDDDTGSNKMVQFDQAMQHYMDERLESIGAEMSYINARIQSLQNDAAHEILNEEEQVEVVEMDLCQQKQRKSKSAKHVTFADQVMGTKPQDDEQEEDEWLDMDALEERYSLPANADPETAHEMALKVVRSLSLDEAEKVLETMVTETTALRMHQHQHEMQMQQLEKTVHDLQHTLVVMRDKAVETAIQSEKRIRRLEQQQNSSSRRSSLLLLQEQNGSRRSSMSGFSSTESTTIGFGDDDDSAIDLRVEEHYQQYGTIFDQIYNEGVSNCGKMVSMAPAPLQQVPCSPIKGTFQQQPPPQPSPTLRPLRPQSLVERPPVAAARRGSMSSPDQFLQQLVQAGLMSAQEQKQVPTEQPSSSLLSSHAMQRRSSDSSSSRPTTPLASSSLLLGRRRRAFSLQQQQPPPHVNHPMLVDSGSRRRFSLRELSLVTDNVHHQPSPLQQEFAVSPTSSTASNSTRYTRNNVFDRLSHAHTKASEAKRASTPMLPA
ncbi:kinesin-domain-containing protein [Lichtheimia hyalospora FSU 10163]|nr:kinesin-domain-containing protein [Lichtheimia hyalospora FSU 10163]